MPLESTLGDFSHYYHHGVAPAFSPPLIIRTGNMRPAGASEKVPPITLACLFLFCLSLLTFAKISTDASPKAKFQ